MHRLTSILPVLALASIFHSGPAVAQSAADFKALEKQIQDLQTKVDRLQKEQADSTVNYSGSGAAAKDVIEENKIKLSSGVTELKLYGDLRERYQYNQFDPQLNAPATTAGSALVGAKPGVQQLDRWRFRLRIGADIQLGDQFFAGVTLATNQASDSNTQTYTEGYDNYNIYIDKAFAGWTPNDLFTVILGKQANPFYTTDLVWDPDITPAGAMESFDISKAFLPDDSRLSLQLIAMQGTFFDNNEYLVGSNNNTDAWQYVEQLKATYKFNKDLSVTFAPGFMTYTAASLSGLQNSLAFSKPQDALTAPNAVQVQTTTTTTNTETIKYDSTGKPSITLTPVNITTTVTTTDPATGAARVVTTQTSNAQTQVTIPFGAKGNNLPANPALANKSFVTTSTTGGGTLTVTTPTGETPAGETRDLAILTAPGDISFKIGGIASKVYWDFAYNTEGGARATNEYFLSTHSSEDDLAWLVGFQLGTNVRGGDWSLYANYRRVGMDSVDPNLNDSDFALSNLNVQGVKVGIAYNFTDSLVGAVTYYHSWLLNHAITGGEATGGATLANAKTSDVLQVDLNLKF